jgi:hypothetical protein
MSLIENAISRAFLKRIRHRRAQEQDLNEEQADELVRKTAVSIREAEFSDFENVDQLNRKLGQGPDSLENWRRLWRDNPAIKDLQAPVRIGWVLEDCGRIVGFLGSIPLCYELSGTPVLAAATCRFAVEPAYRAFSHLLVMAFFRQKEYQLFIDSSATPAAGKIMAAVKAQVLPQKDYDTILFWILNAGRYSAYVLRKMGVGKYGVTAGTILGQVALRVDGYRRNLALPAFARGCEVKEEKLSSLGMVFEGFINKIRCEKRGLLGKRTPEILCWHFEPPQNRRPVSVLACYQNREMKGYLILRLYEEMREGLRRAVVADLLIEKDDPKVLAALLRSALQAAKKSGADILEVAGFPSEIRGRISSFRPYSRKLPANPFYFKTREKELQEVLKQEAVWYASSFDGDSTLWP